MTNFDICVIMKQQIHILDYKSCILAINQKERFMFSNQGKWLVMREMVKEKQYELTKYIKLLSNRLNAEQRFKQVNSLIKSRFMPQNMKESFDSNWRDYLSSVDLLQLYHYMNKILYFFYSVAPVHIEEKSSKGGVLFDYNFHFVGENDPYHALEDLYKSIYNIIKTITDVNKYFVLDGETATLKFSGKPKSKEKSNIDLYDVDIRKGVVAELIDDAVARYENSTHKRVKENLQERRRAFKLYPHPDYKEMGLTDLDYVKESITDDEPKDFSLIRKMIGLDCNGHPVYESREGYFDTNGIMLPDDIFIDTNWKR